jgi:2-polyprenyl-6-methoxyphenol hydroxylase-like FAD-dependent oxidoreductase
MSVVANRSARTSDTDWIIVGAGIAGPVAAVALARAGIRATVYEAADVPRDDLGAFFNVAPNGIAVLRALGLDSALEEAGFRNDRLAFFNERGRLLTSVAVGGITVMRGELSARLRSAAEQRGVRFVFGKRLAGVEADVSGVVARFSDGTAVRAAAIVGADGVHSRTRACVLPEAPRPVYSGFLNVGGVVGTDLPPTGEAMHMVFGYRGFFGYAVRPSGATYWFSNFVQEQEPARGDAADLLPPAVVRERLLDVHRDDPPEVTRIVEATAGGVGAYAVHDLPPLRRWHRGRVVLIGDAAHAIAPHAGQGVSLALEDAFVLAECVRAHGDPAAAFRAFDVGRQGRVVPVIRQSRRTAKQKQPAGWLGRRIRDLVLPIFLRQSAAAVGELYRTSPAALDAAARPQSGQATGLAGFGSIP